MALTHADELKRLAAVAAVAEARRWCRAVGVPAVDTDALVDTTTNNPDGLHWGWDSHDRVGRATAAALRGTGWDRP